MRFCGCCLLIVAIVFLDLKLILVVIDLGIILVIRVGLIEVWFM